MTVFIQHVLLALAQLLYLSAYSNAFLSNGCVLQNGNGSFYQPNNGFIQQNCDSQQNSGLQPTGILLHQPNGFSQPNFITSQENSGTMQQFNFQPDCFMLNGVVYNAVGIGYHNAFLEMYQENFVLGGRAVIQPTI